MKRPEIRLFHTTAFKLAMQSVGLYGCILLVVFASLYWVNSSRIDDSVNTEIEQQLLMLQQLYATSGSEQLIKQIKQLQQTDAYFYLLQSEAGKKIAGNLMTWPEDADIEFNAITQSLWLNEEALPVGLQDDDAYLPVAAVKLSNAHQLLIAANIEQANYLHELSEFLLEAMSFSILFAALIAIILGQKILGRMDIISASASKIMAGDLSQRIPISKNHDEFDTLAERLNAMLDRIQKLIRGIRDVTDNIAHDLRSPLTRMRNHMEITLLETRSPQEYQHVLRHSIVEMESLIKTFNSLLSIAQTQAGNHRTHWSQVSLKQLAMDLMDLYKPLTLSKGQTLQVINGEDSFITGSRDLLAQSFGNLLENAIKYTPHGGAITLLIKTSAEHITVIVEDSGPGIPNTEKEHVLEKFVRLESSRHSPGNGLGLSLVAAVAGLHKAELILQDTKPGNPNPGLQVIQIFPR